MLILPLPVDQQQTAADEDGMFTSQLIVLLLYIGFIAAYGYFSFRQYSEKGQVHLAVILLGVAIALQALALLMELMHLFVFGRDGMGLRWRHSWFPADFFSEILQGESELLCALVLIALAFGWTIPTPDLVMNPVSRNSFLSSLAHPADWISKLTPASVFVISLVLSQIVLELLGRRFEDDFNQFHDHEHWPGYTQMLIRVGLAGLFSFGIIRSRVSEAVRYCCRCCCACCFRYVLLSHLFWSLARLTSPHSKSTKTIMFCFHCILFCCGTIESGGHPSRREQVLSATGFGRRVLVCGLSTVRVRGFVCRATQATPVGYCGRHHHSGDIRI